MNGGGFGAPIKSKVESWFGFGKVFFAFDKVESFVSEKFDLTKGTDESGREVTTGNLTLEFDFGGVELFQTDASFMLGFE